MKIYISNAFALSMLDRDTQRADRRYGDVQGRTPRIPVPQDDPVGWLRQWEPHAEIISIVGHADTAALFTRLLRRPIAFNRASVKLEPGSLLLVGQYCGPRLPEGVTTIPDLAKIEWFPDGAKIEWWMV